jgi:uncharacterized protein (TIRG00374 family)
MIKYKSMKKSAISIAIRVSVSALLIIILLYIMRDKYDAIVAAVAQASIPLVSLSFILFAGATAIASMRLRMIISAQGQAGVTFLEALSLSFIGYFFNNFLPTAIGGDFVKGYYLAKKTQDNTGSYTSVFIDRAMGLFTMIFMAFTALFFIPQDAIDARAKNALYVISACAVIFVLFMMNKSVAKKFSFLLAMARPIEEKLKTVYNAVHGYRRHTSVIIKTFLISIVSQLMFFSAIAILAASIGSSVSWLDTLLRIPIVSAMSLLPSINGLGLREGSMVVLFGPLIGRANALAVSILWLLILFVLSIIGGAIYGLSPQFRVRI